MSVYREFVDEIERRQARVARKNFWFTAMFHHRRKEMRWKVLFAILIFIVAATLLGAAMFQDGCNPPNGTAPGPRIAPAAASISAAARIAE